MNNTKIRRENTRSGFIKFCSSLAISSAFFFYERGDSIRKARPTLEPLRWIHAPYLGQVIYSRSRKYIHTSDSLLSHSFSKHHLEL